MAVEDILEEKLRVTVELSYAHAHGPAIRLFSPTTQLL